MIISKPDGMSEREAQNYVKYLEEKHNRKVVKLKIDMD